MAGKVFQHSTLGALMAGQFDGSLTIDKLLEQGNVGLGTLHGLDGELVLVDGKAYQVKVDGSVEQLKGDEKTPYAAATFFNPEQSVKVKEEQSIGVVKDQLLQRFSSRNTFQAVRIAGRFRSIRCRSVAKQTPPYPKLVEVTRSQAVFTRDSVQGTLVGFYAPEMFGGVAAPGFHWHFVSRDLDFGGHVLDFTLEDASVEWQTMETIEQHFPVENDVFMQAELENEQLHKEMDEAEN